MRSPRCNEVEGAYFEGCLRSSEGDLGKVLLLYILAADICGRLFGASILFGLVLALGAL